jgi:hypothetical protein
MIAVIQQQNSLRPYWIFRQEDYGALHFHKNSTLSVDEEGKHYVVKSHKMNSDVLSYH